MSNVVVVASPLVLVWRTRRVGRALGVAAIAAVILNALWPWPLGSFEELRIGYYVWWVSFGVLAVAMFRMDVGPEAKERSGLTTAST
jgi:hypothetical protein